MIVVHHFVPTCRVGDPTGFEHLVHGLWSGSLQCIPARVVRPGEKQGMAVSTCTRASGRMAFYPRRCETWGRFRTLIPSGSCWMLGKSWQTWCSSIGDQIFHHRCPDASPLNISKCLLVTSRICCICCSPVSSAEDGDLDANWIESMNSVMDDSRLLTLPSNERIPLKLHMKMIFEARQIAGAWDTPFWADNM